MACVDLDSPARQYPLVSVRPSLREKADSHLVLRAVVQLGTHSLPHRILKTPNVVESRVAAATEARLELERCEGASLAQAPDAQVCGQVLSTSRPHRSAERNAPTSVSETRSCSDDGIQASLPRLKSERTASAFTGSKACMRAKEELVTGKSRKCRSVSSLAIVREETASGMRTERKSVR